MKLKYYSHYPYNRKDFKFLTQAEKEVIYGEEAKEDWCQKSSIPAFKYKLLLSAVCEGEAESEKDFVKHCWNILDEAAHNRKVKSIHKDFTLQGVKCTQTSNLYGATNSEDGLYIIGDHIYIVRFISNIDRVSSIKEGIDISADRWAGRCPLGIDYELDTIEHYNESLTK